MNCIRCGMPLEKNARFCRNCGQPVSATAPDSAATNSQPSDQQVDSVVREDSPTKPVGPVQVLPPPSTPSTQPSQSEQVWLGSPPTPQSQESYYQPTQYVTPGNVPAEHPLAGATTQSTRPRRRRGGCLSGCLAILLVLIILLLAGWLFALHPYLDTLAQNQINLALADAVNQIPPSAALSPAGTVVVNENAVNNLIVLNSAPSDLVQNVHMLITPSNVELDFQVQVTLGTQVLSYPGSFTAVPQVSNGQLIVTQVQVSPILGLIMSPGELTTIINSHLADAQARFRHPIMSILLKNHELDLTVGPPSFALDNNPRPPYTRK